MKDLLGVLILGIMAVLPGLLIALDIIFGKRKKEYWIFELLAFFIGSVYMAIAYLLWGLPNYKSPLNAYDVVNAHEPFSTEHIVAIIVFAVWGFFSYFFLKFIRRQLPPLVEVFLLAGVYVGCVLCLMWIFQLICGARPAQPSPEIAQGNTHIYLDVFDFIEIFCLCIVPVIYLIHAALLMIKLVKEKAQKQESIHYENVVLQRLNLWFLKGANLFWTAGIALLPVLGILMLLLILFGQQPDSIILAFTKTSDWILSGEVAPPPVAYDTHYLCTVSLRGHKKLVKPVRYGIRRGEKIVVNRQLCVANAFEQLIMERAPRFHRAVRSFYDTYGYPISRHINHAWAADITYILMKPLEWVF